MLDENRYISWHNRYSWAPPSLLASAGPRFPLQSLPSHLIPELFKASKGFSLQSLVQEYQ